MLCTRLIRCRLVQRSRFPQMNVNVTQASMHLLLHPLHPVDHGITKDLLVAWKTVVRCSMRNRTSARGLLFDPDQTFFLLQQLVQEAQQLCMQLQPCMQLPLLLSWEQVALAPLTFGSPLFKNIIHPCNRARPQPTSAHLHPCLMHDAMALCAIPLMPLLPVLMTCFQVAFAIYHH